MTFNARVAGSGAIQIGPPQCDGVDALGGQTVAAAHPGRVYPPFPLTEAQIPLPGGAQGYFYVPSATPPVPAESFAANADPSGFNPTVFYGTPLNGSNWGVASEVMKDGDHTRARWEFEVHADNPICGALISTDGSIPPRRAYDGHPFNDPHDGSYDSFRKFDIEADGAVVGSNDDPLSVLLPEAFSSYLWIPTYRSTATSWAIVYDTVLGGGGFDGFHFYSQLSIVSFLLYTLGSRGASAVPGSGAHRNYPR